MTHARQPLPITLLSLPALPEELALHLHEVFDAIFVINLSRRADRWKKINEALARHKVNPARVHRVEAVDGRALEGSAPTVLGCVRSHARVHAEVLFQGYPTALVLEDDVLFPEDLERTLAGIARAEDPWELLILGRCRGWGSFAYAVTPSASRVLQRLLSEEKAPADVVLLFEAPKHVKTFAVEVFGHADEKDSDILHEPIGASSPEKPAKRRVHGAGSSSEIVFRSRKRLS